MAGTAETNALPDFFFDVSGRAVKLFLKILLRTSIISFCGTMLQESPVKEKFSALQFSLQKKKYNKTEKKYKAENFRTFINFLNLKDKLNCSIIKPKIQKPHKECGFLKNTEENLLNNNLFGN